jgi:hypothetical protein
MSRHVLIKTTIFRQVSNRRRPTATDFDSVVEATLARTKLISLSEETIQEWIFKACSDIKIVVRQVLSLRNPRETDFDSVVVTT